MRRIIGLLLLALSSVVSVHAEAVYTLPTEQQEAQFKHLLKELRCLVCQNQNLADSNAALAQDLKTTVYDLVREGKSDSEIITYLTARYGDFILFNPPLKALTFLLWGGPLLFLFIGLVIFWRYIYE